MKEQYVGDVNDYRKYALIRHLAKAGRVTVGICWMLTPPEAGNLRYYVTDPGKWRGYDADLFDQLQAIVRQEEVSRLAAIESRGVLPGACFYNAPLTNGTDRKAYFAAALDHLSATDLVFFDPDNGIASNTSKESPRRFSRFIYPDEIAAAYRRGHSVLVYQHFPRKPRNEFIAELGIVLGQVAPGSGLWGFRTQFAVFLLLIHPRHAAGLVAAAINVPANWRPQFICAARLAGATE